MKFLTFVDLHGDKKILKELVDRVKEDDIDFVICAGDLSMFGRGLKFVLKKFNDLGKKFYVLPGNHESDRMFKEVLGDYKECINFNHKVFVKDDYVFLGYGEGGFSMEDPQFRKIARQWYGKYSGKKIVLVLHGPPYNTKIDLLDKRHVGNKDFRKFIERIKPKLVICGHLHETVGAVDKIGRTKIVHPGWKGMVIELK